MRPGTQHWSLTAHCKTARKFMNASLDSCQEEAILIRYSSVSKQYDMKGGYLEMHEGVQHTRRVYCYADTGHCIEVAKPKCVSCSWRKQHLQRGCVVAPPICLEPIPVPRTHQCTDRHRRAGRGAGGQLPPPQFEQFVDINSGRESKLFGQNTIHV